MRPGDKLLVRFWGEVLDQVGRRVPCTRAGEWSDVRFLVEVEQVRDDVLTLTSARTGRVRVSEANVEVCREDEAPRPGAGRRASGWTRLGDVLGGGR